MTFNSQELETKIMIELVRKKGTDQGMQIYEDFVDRYHHRHIEEMIFACDQGKAYLYFEKRADILNRYVMMMYGIPDQR